MKNFVLELRKRNFLFFVVKSFGKGSGRKNALLEAKRPINIPRGFVYKLDYKPLWIIQDSLNHVLKGSVTGIAIPGVNNRIMWIDIEHNLVNEVNDDILDRFNGCYIEKTPRGGLHIALKIDYLKLVRWKGVKGAPKASKYEKALKWLLNEVGGYITKVVVVIVFSIMLNTISSL